MGLGHIACHFYQLIYINTEVIVVWEGEASEKLSSPFTSIDSFSAWTRCINLNLIQLCKLI